MKEWTPLLRLTSLIQSCSWVLNWSKGNQRQNRGEKGHLQKIWVHDGVGGCRTQSHCSFEHAFPINQCMAIYTLGYFKAAHESSIEWSNDNQRHPMSSYQRQIQGEQILWIFSFVLYFYILHQDAAKNHHYWWFPCERLNSNILFYSWS